MGSNGQHHIIPQSVYFKILGILLVLTVVTVIAARVDFGFLNPIIAMAIASAKAYYVLAYFMHLKYDDKLFTVAFFSSIFFLVLLFAFVILDAYTRVAQGSIL
jgi:cytochrome c oxidase subunit IV